MKSPLHKFQEQLRQQSRAIHKISQRILTEPKNPKLYPNARQEANQAQKDRKTPASLLKTPLGNVQSSAIKTEIFLGFNYIPNPDKNDHYFFENYVIVPKESQQYLTDDFSMKFVIFALNDIREAVVNLKFYGLRPTNNYKRREKFERINYEMFKNLNLDMPERLAHLSRKKKKLFRRLYRVNNLVPGELQGDLQSVNEADGKKKLIAEESTDLTLLQSQSQTQPQRKRRVIKLPEIVQQNINDVWKWKNMNQIKKKMSQIRLQEWEKKRQIVLHKKAQLEKEKEHRNYLITTRFERQRAENLHIIETILRVALKLTRVTNWMKVVTKLIILMGIRERFMVEKKRRFDNLILKKKATLIAVHFKSRVEVMVKQKHHIKDFERIKL